MARPHPWEKSYPAGVRWDAPIATSTLAELLDKGIAAFGDRPALEYRDQRTTFRELGDAVNRVAAGLLRLGVGRGDAIALLLPNTPAYPIAFFAAMRLGARVVNLSPLDAERELAAKLKDSGARTLVTTNIGGLLQRGLALRTSGLLDHLIAGDDRAYGPSAIPTEPIPEVRCISLQALMTNASIPAQWPQVATDDIALLQYTGGTTGAFKGAMLTHRNLTAAVSIYEAWFAPQRAPAAGPLRVICVLPLFHIFALTTLLLRHVKLGNEILLRPRFDVETTLRDIEVKRAAYLSGVPTMWIALLARPGIENCDFSSLQICSSGGAPLPVEVAQRFERVTKLPLRNGWGMTETSPAGTNWPLQGASRPGSIGLPLPGIMLEVVALDDPRRALPPGEIGELRIKGENVTKGYWNRPEETAAAFVDDFFLTGDIGSMDEDGYFYLVDRKNDMIISGGFNVYPRVIEDAIYEHPDVEEAVVIGISDSYRGEAAKAFVKLRAGAPMLTLEVLRDFLADKLGRHEIPALLEIRPKLPRTAIGKLSKKELVEEERRKPALSA
jgi:long-chain acyl-CoA synthetase